MNNIIHLITPYLFHTGSWVYTQLSQLTNFGNVVFTYRKENVDQFPFEPVYSVSDFLFYKRIIVKVYRKIFGDQYGLFFGRYIKKHKPLLFHAHMGYEAVRWFKLIKKSKLPLIVTFYGLDVSQLAQIPYWKKKYQDIFAYGTYFLAEGSYLKKQLVDIGCPEEKVIIQHLGIELENYPVKTLSNDIDKVSILQISTFREKKGIEYSLEAISLLKEKYPNLEFKIIGSGDSEISTKRIYEYAEKLKISDNIKFLGIKSHKDSIAEMYNSDIFLHPSVTASNGDNEGGAPVSVIEASAVQLPVVSTFHADIPEVIINNRTGILVEERNSRALAEALEKLINDPLLRFKYGAEGRRHIEANYNLSKQLSSQEQIYNRILNEE